MISIGKRGGDICAVSLLLEKTKKIIVYIRKNLDNPWVYFTFDVANYMDRKPSFWWKGETSDLRGEIWI
jgi:hypothetical protein